LNFRLHERDVRGHHFWCLSLQVVASSGRGKRFLCLDAQKMQVARNPDTLSWLSRFHEGRGIDDLLSEKSESMNELVETLETDVHLVAQLVGRWDGFLP
jgi:hypothetical protein